MYNKKVLLVCSVTLIETTLASASYPAFASDGDKLFQQHCSRCHQSPTNIKSPPDKIASVLSSGTIRQHRFSIDNDTIQVIVDYISQVKS